MPVRGTPVGAPLVAKMACEQRVRLRGRLAKCRVSDPGARPAGTRPGHAVAVSNRVRRLRALVRASLLDPARELLDLALRAVELLAAERVQLLAALPQCERLVERRPTVLEPADDLLELRLGLLERQLRLTHRVRPRRVRRARRPP